MLARFGYLRKSDLPLHRAIISDIVLWILLVLGLSLAVYWLAIRMPEQEGQSILLKFRDANQITRGSAVTMLGTDVGYVKGIRIHQDHVDVMVQTFSKSLSIPSGATFTVVFNGLAGSKSIDIEVPRTPLPEMDGRPVYTVAEPIRLKTLLDYVVDMTQGLTKGAELVADFFGKRKPVEELQFNIHQAHQWTLDSLTYADTLTRDMQSLQHDLDGSVDEGIRTLEGFSRRTQLLAQQSDPTLIRPQVVSALQTLRGIRNAFIPALPGAPTIATHINRWNAISMKVNIWTGKAIPRAQAFPLAHILDRIESGEDQFISFLDQMQAFFDCNNKQRLQEFRRNIQAFNRQVLALSLKMGPTPSGAIQPRPAKPCCPPLPSHPKRIPLKPPRPASAGVVKPFPIVDRSGHIQKHPNTWWDNHPAAKQEAAISTIQTRSKYIHPKLKEDESEPAFFIPLLQGMNNFVSVVWDSLVAFFTG